jgi:phenylalanyl-tRNA synthetase beta chain
LGLQTDSSFRFERGVDIDRTEWACKRAAELMQELAGGEIVKGFIDAYPNKLEMLKVGLRISQLNKITGIEFTKEQATELLGKIDIKYLGDKEQMLMFEIPNARREDLVREADLIEEVIRLHGYEKITDAEYDRVFFDTKSYYNSEFDFTNKMRDHFTGRGFKEVITNSLVDEKTVSRFGESYISLMNPSSDKMTVLRTSLYDGLFEVIKSNFEHMNNSLKLFEIGNTFAYDEKGKIIENKSVLITLAGDYDVESFDVKPRYFDLLDIKAEVKALLEKLNIANYNINYYNYNGNFEFQVDYRVNGSLISKISKFNDKFLRSLDIEKPVIVCEFPCLA